ncbi:MAG: DUF4920 domain-containing protein [Bacteroidetes bacterium]|nr:DUF4920 domain-containing protein [Bacteroidota bacterium]
MKLVAFSAVTLSAFILGSCCGCGGNGTEDALPYDSTHVSETTHHEEEEATIAFDGVDKGEYVLYGHTDILADSAATVTEMFAEMESTGAFNRKVSVKIAEVCQQAGCWITFDDEKGGAIRVFFRDHFTIPIETPAGTEAVLYGSLVMDTLSVDFQKHLLDDSKAAGEEVTQEQYDAIKEDKIETTFDCESILVKKQH